MTADSRVDPRPLIAHVVYRFDVGGLENGVVNLINRLPEASWRHAVIALTHVAPTFSRRIGRDVQYVELQKPPGHLWKLYPRLFRMFRDLRPSVVHTRNLAALEAVVPAALAGVPVRVHGEHGRDALDPDGARVRYQWVRRLYSPFVSRYVSVSKDLGNYLHDRAGIDINRITQIYNGVDTDVFRPAVGGRPAIDGCPFGSEHWLCGTVGRMDAVKDQINLAHAFVLAVRANPAGRARMRLVLVGEGALRSECERILREGGCRDLTWFAGERHDVASIMRGLDCFVLPSRGEGISNTILEAMACALPVVATRVGGTSELIDNGITGMMVEASDSDALSRALGVYFEDPALAQRHGRAARQRIEHTFSLERMVDAYHQLYLAQLRAGPGATSGKLANLPSVER